MFDQSLNTQHISSNLNLYEAARSSFFVFEVSDLTNLLKINYKGDIADATANDFMDPRAAEYIRLNVVKCDMKDFSVDPQEFRRGNDVVKFAGLPKWDAGSITVDDIVGLDTKSILTAWLHLVYNPHTRKGGRMKDYKKTCTLLEYTQDYELIRSWTLEGCFVTSLTNEGWDREGGEEKRQIEATISYDRAVMHLPDEEEA